MRWTPAGVCRTARVLAHFASLFLLGRSFLALAERNTSAHRFLLDCRGRAAQSLCRLRCCSAARELLQGLELACRPGSPITGRTFCHHHLQNSNNPRIIHVGRRMIHGERSFVASIVTLTGSFGAFGRPQGPFRRSLGVNSNSLAAARVCKQTVSRSCKYDFRWRGGGPQEPDIPRAPRHRAGRRLVATWWQTVQSRFVTERHEVYRAHLQVGMGPTRLILCGLRAVFCCWAAPGQRCRSGNSQLAGRRVGAAPMFVLCIVGGMHIPGPAVADEDPYLTPFTPYPIANDWWRGGTRSGPGPGGWSDRACDTRDQ